MQSVGLLTLRGIKIRWLSYFLEALFSDPFSRSSLIESYRTYSMAGMAIQRDGSLLIIAWRGISALEPPGSEGYAFSFFAVGSNDYRKAIFDLLYNRKPRRYGMLRTTSLECGRWFRNRKQASVTQSSPLSDFVPCTNHRLQRKRANAPKKTCFYTNSLTREFLYV